MTIFFAIVFLALMALCGYQLFRTKASRKGRARLYIALTTVFAILFAIVPFGFGYIDNGQVGVIKQFGRINGVLEPGLYWVFYPTTTVEVYDTKVQQNDILTWAYSQDSQSMEASLSIQFRIQPVNVEKINTEYGSLERLTQQIRSVSEERLKVVLASKSAMDLIASRNVLSAMIETQISEAVKKYYVDIVTVALRDITFNEAFESAVEQKMIAEQEKLKAEYDKQKAIIKAEEQLEVAKKEAEAAIEKARGDAESIKAIAEAEAEAIKAKSIEIARMLGFEINEDGSINMEGKTPAEIKVISDYLRYAEYLAKWDGKLPNVIGSDANVIIPMP